MISLKQNLIMKFVTNLFKALLVGFVIGNTIAIYLLFEQVQELRKPVPQPNTIVQLPVGEDVDLSGYATKEYVNESVGALQEVPEEPPVPIKPAATPTPSKQTTIIPISTTFNTQSLDWVDVTGSDFYLDLVGDYGEDAKAFWEAFVYEAHGNGRVFARLYDVTHSIGVVGSDLETNSATSKLETSAGALAIWRGKNLYRAQIKSEKGFPVYFNSGRLRISY